ncbi:MAG: hypothetical protein AVDCRST_MAG93-8415 [uncultured Chloroflexia bacterium]|uniref:Uncharacterized protein n=1 Tax=uncultured Chloroflexia bacterium TaxID=1672391 RepID=A0A6J4MWM5_9CHLR|nr:MAG: hypothetical protein AVDCRST_MAG93-8415 [uncultured Chloroflexia bacterium]
MNRPRMAQLVEKYLRSVITRKEEHPLRARWTRSRPSFGTAPFAVDYRHVEDPPLPELPTSPTLAYTGGKNRRSQALHNH